MKLGIAGTGKIVQEALSVILSAKPDKVYLAGREHSAERTEKLCRQYGLDGYFLDYEEMLESDADTVYIAVPNSLHASFAGKALRAGKHVILEKPATVRKEELEDLFSLAGKQKRILVEAMSLHFLPAWQSLSGKIGDLGRIRLACFQFCQYSSRYDAFLRGEVAPAFDTACAGGALMDLGIYNIHAIVSLFGEPENVQYFPNMERGIDVSGILVMEYGDFQAVSIAAKECQSPTSSTIQGTEGCIRIPVPANQVDRYEIWDNAGHVQKYDYSGGKHRLFWEWQEFTRMIAEEDFGKVEELEKISLQAMGVIDRARTYMRVEI